MKALALALLCAVPAAAQTAERAGERIVATAAEQAAVAVATERGRLIYAYDRAAWLGTDAMFAKVGDPASKLAGYIADGPADAPRLIFFDRQPTPQAYFVAQLRDNRLVSSRLLRADEDRALPAGAMRRLRALATATAAMRTAGLRACGSAAFNTVVLPVDPASGVTRVYFLTPQPDSSHLPFGGHYAIDVAADGTAGSPRAFASACMAMPIRPPGGEPVAISHVLDPTPTEIHVFSSLALGKPVYVLTTRPVQRVWTVADGRIEGPRPLSAR